MRGACVNPTLARGLDSDSGDRMQVGLDTLWKRGFGVSHMVTFCSCRLSPEPREERQCGCLLETGVKMKGEREQTVVEDQLCTAALVVCLKKLSQEPVR